MDLRRFLTIKLQIAAVAVGSLLAGCATTVDSAGPAAPTASPATASTNTLSPSLAPIDKALFQKDRRAILAMAGDHKVKFDFIETVSFVDGYEPKERKISGAHEMVRVLEDRGDFISLQHTLIVGGDEKFVVKHWRQDWAYEPDHVLVFIGGNAWEMRPVAVEKRRGRWSQTVYQVDDSPRYGAVGQWSHDNGISEWLPPAEWRPLPRRDMTTRDDYHAVDAINRHAIAPWGWVHEQDNSKLVLRAGQQTLVREIGTNSYNKVADYDFSAGEAYWRDTGAYWQRVREIWRGYETPGATFAITIKGETQDLYVPLMEAAEAIRDGEMNVDDAVDIAEATIQKYTTASIGNLQDRLRPTQSN
ncbi:MAG: DUF6607 family protein [Pseudomonadota bacterium]